jgi:GDPmannose 4,6-dehydratase
MLVCGRHHARPHRFMTQSKKALICGVSGQDGSYLAKLLLEKGYEVVGTARDAQTASLHNHRIVGIFGRVRMESMATHDFRSVLQVMRKHCPDEVYNLSGQSSVGLSFDQPVETLDSIIEGTLNLLEVIRFLGHPIRFYNAGSSECFGNTGPEGANEEDAFRPRSPYAVAKAAAFWLVANYREAYRLHACTGILFNHESPLRPLRFVTQKIIAAAARIAAGSGEKLRLGNVEIRRDWGWAPEYVDAMWRMLQQDHADDYIVATGESHSLLQFVQEAFSQVGVDWEKHVEISETLFRPTDIAEGKGNAAKAERALGWKATVKMQEVIARMLQAQPAGVTAK